MWWSLNFCRIWSFPSWQHLMSYQDGYWLMRMYTYGKLIVLSHWESKPPVPMISHSLILFWYWANQSLFYPNNADPLTRKWQISLFTSLVGLNQVSNPCVQTPQSTSRRRVLYSPQLHYLHYPDTEQTSLRPILAMPSAKLDSGNNKLCKSLAWLRQDSNPRPSAREANTIYLAYRLSRLTLNWHITYGFIKLTDTETAVQSVFTLS